MTKIYKVIKIEDYGIVVDENINPQYMDWYGLTDSRNVVNGVDRRDSNTSWVYKDSPKVIATIGKRLDGVPLIELPDEANTYATNVLKNGLTIDGIKQEYSLPQMAQIHALIYFAYKTNTNKYSEEDMMNFGLYLSNNVKKLKNKMIEGILQDYLQKQPIPTEVELEMEIVDYKYPIGDNTNDGNGIPIYDVIITNKETNTITAINYKL